MIQEYGKGLDIKLSPNFSTSEFDCKCDLPSCTYTLVDSDLIDALELLRAKVDAPIQVKWAGGGSGYRCSAHNKAVRGKPGSLHLVGKAADIRCIKLSTQALFQIADQLDYFKHGGLGIGFTFLHTDTRGYKSRWRY